MTAIKDARKKSGYTQAQAAEMSGIPLGTLRRWEQGVNEPNIDAIIMLADIYGVSTDVLLGSDFSSIEYDSSSLADDERELLLAYRALDEDKRATLLAVAKAM